MFTTPDQHDYDESLEAAYAIESHGRHSTFQCRKCPHRYTYRKGPLSHHAAKHLHEHAATHEPE